MLMYNCFLFVPCNNVDVTDNLDWSYELCLIKVLESCTMNIIDNYSCAIE
jgi:hypothetical protein